MSGTISRNPEHAIGAFIHVKGKIDDMIQEMDEISQDQFGHAPEDVHWATVGSLDHVCEQIRQALEAMRRLSGKETGR